ncbi:MAG: hypothetical protein PUB97_11295 [Ruminococcus sp.]|nr:hypothetical protein [Ruminococcus sp.]
MRNGRKQLPRIIAHSSNRMLGISAVLICLTLFSVYQLSGVFARFGIREQNGDAARTACFSPSISMDSDAKVPLDITKPGDDAIIKFSVQNFSDERVTETTTRYQITLKTTGNLPLDFTLSDGENNILVDNWKCNGNGESVYKYQNTPTFTVETTETHQYILKAKWDKSKNEAKFSGQTDAVYIAVEFIQVD